MTHPNAYILRLLRSQAHQLAHEVNLVPADAVLWKPEPAEWSVHECLTHLRDAERHIFLARITRFVKENNPSLSSFDEAAHHKKHWNPGEPIQKILTDFVEDRAAEVGLLQSSDWSRTAVHAVRGPITLGWQADYVLGHTWEHLSQIMRVRLDYATKK